MKEKVIRFLKQFKEFEYKEYAKTNIMFLTFVITSVLNGMILRFFTVHNYFAIKPVLADLAVTLLFGSFVYLFKPKSRFRYLIILSVIFTLVCLVNSIYYSYYISFASFSLIAVLVELLDVTDAVTENVLQIKDFIFLWQPILLLILHNKLKKQDYYNTVAKKEKSKKKKFMATLTSGVIVYALFFMTVTGVEYSRLSKQWNREFLVTKFGIYTYQLNDLFKSLDAKFNTLFGYDNAAKEFREFYSDAQINEENKWTNKFKDKNVIVIHAESFQALNLNQQFNGIDVAPNMKKLANEGIYFNNFYAQASSGTSSDTEFTFSTSLLPVTNGAVAVSYWDREYESIQKLLKNQGYRTISMHANNCTFWNRDNFHESLGYDKFYCKKEYDIDDEIGLGLSDKSFFKQSVQKLKKEYEKNDKVYATLITLSNHTPFSDTDKYGEFDVDIKENVTTINENGEQVTETVSHPYMEGTDLGNYFKSVHYADEAIGVFIEEMDKEGLLDDTVIVIYGDHDAKLTKKDYTRLYNYDTENDSVLDDDNENYTQVDYYKYELDRRVPFIIWTKNEKLETNVDTAMGMIDAMPTLGNMLGFKPKYALGSDVISKKDNIIVFPNGNWMTNNIYYNSQKDEYKVLNSDYIVGSEEVEKNNEYASKRLEVSNDIIKFDLIKNENSRLERIEGE